MKINVNPRYISWLILNSLVIMDIILLIVVFSFNVPVSFENFVRIFDLIICIILLAELALNFFRADSKKDFIKDPANWVDLIAAIPYDIILPMMFSSIRLLRIFRLLSLLRLFALSGKYAGGVTRFLKRSRLDKIVLILVIIIIGFTLMFYVLGSYSNFLDSFYFVLVTLASVGYGDIVPKTYNEKVLSIMLIIVGIFIFSTITAAISSYLTDRLIVDGEDEDDVHSLNYKLEAMHSDLDEIKKENKELKDEIRELKEIMAKK